MFKFELPQVLEEKNFTDEQRQLIGNLLFMVETGRLINDLTDHPLIAMLLHVDSDLRGMSFGPITFGIHAIACLTALTGVDPTRIMHLANDFTALNLEALHQEVKSFTDEHGDDSPCANCAQVATCNKDLKHEFDKQQAEKSRDPFREFVEDSLDIQCGKGLDSEL